MHTRRGAVFQTAPHQENHHANPPNKIPIAMPHKIKGKSGLRRIINACGYTRDGFKAACEEQGFRQLLWLNIPLIVFDLYPTLWAGYPDDIDCVILSVAYRRTLQYRRRSRRGSHIAGKNTRWPSGRKMFAPPRRAWLCCCLPCCGYLPCGE